MIPESVSMDGHCHQAVGRVAEGVQRLRLFAELNHAATRTVRRGCSWMIWMSLHAYIYIYMLVLYVYIYIYIVTFIQ